MSSEPITLPPPSPKDHPRISPWLDEQVWGHRLWDGQTPWLLFLEFLGVAEACHRDGRLLDAGGPYYPLRYRPFKRMFLRNVLFNNEGLDRVGQRHPDSSAAWNEWLRAMNEGAWGVPTRDFSYLSMRFPNFHDFAKLVNMFRSSTVEGETGRRWTSRFVFPFGPQALYEDLNITEDGVERGYVNFGRTGELLYQMLCRSSSVDGLRSRLGSLFANTNPWNRLLTLFQPHEDQDRDWRGHSYLPYERHRRFDHLGHDCLQILDLSLPSFDPLGYLVPLCALHILLYQLTVAAEWAGDGASPALVCEVVAPRKTLVREQSLISYQQNNALSERAVRAYVRSIESSAEWQTAVGQPDAFSRCKDILKRRVWWGDAYEGSPTPEALIAELRSDALAKHRQHAAQVHRTYGRQIGLVSKRGTIQLRYAPTDGLLKSLVLANVGRRLEFKQFLSVLFDRYGLVFGDREAEHVLAKEDFERKAFRANAMRLEQRLGSLGLLRRLSDACAYIENPYARNLS